MGVASYNTLSCLLNNTSALGVLVRACQTPLVTVPRNHVRKDIEDLSLILDLQFVESKEILDG